MPQIDDTILKKRLADALKVSPVTKLSAYWDDIIADSNNSAWMDIQSALQNRGFNAAQIDAWDRGEEFNKDIGLFWCFAKGAALHDFDATFVKWLDRRMELHTVKVNIALAPQEPGDVDRDQVNTGPLSIAASAFVDPRTGEFMQW